MLYEPLHEKSFRHIRAGGYPEPPSRIPARVSGNDWWATQPHMPTVIETLPRKPTFSEVFSFKLHALSELKLCVSFNPRCSQNVILLNIYNDRIDKGAPIEHSVKEAFQLSPNIGLQVRWI